MGGKTSLVTMTAEQRGEGKEGQQGTAEARKASHDFSDRSYKSGAK
jgi:hypothetical protein